MSNKISSGITVTIGYLLSPLSWWNDLLINMPIAYGFAYLCSLFNKHIFLPAMVAGYWLTNIAGFILMHYGGQKLLSNKSKKYSKNDFYKDIMISLCYTLLVYIFFKIGWLKLPTN
jgi:hypothetical protein